MRDNMENEKSLIRLGVPPTRHIFFGEKGLSSNQLKLYVGLQYAASKLPDLEEGKNANISTLPEFSDLQDKEEPPRWKKIIVTNWNELLTSIGFDIKHSDRLKEDLNQLTRVQIPSYKMMINEEQYTVTTRGSAIIRTKKIKHDKSGRIREFSIMVGGYTPILNGWWQSITPRFLFYQENPSPPVWKFIIYLSGEIRAQLHGIKKYLINYGSPKFWTFKMNMDHLEDKMGIANQRNEYKASVWKEIYTIMGTEGTTIIEGTFFPEKKIKAYGLEDFCRALIDSYWEAKGFGKFNRKHISPGIAKQIKRQANCEQLALREAARKDSEAIIFLLTKRQLSEWLPLSDLKKTKPGEIEVLNP